MRAGVHNWMHDNNVILGDFDVASHRILNAETKLNGGILGDVPRADVLDWITAVVFFIMLILYCFFRDRWSFLISTSITSFHSFCLYLMVDRLGVSFYG